MEDVDSWMSVFYRGKMDRSFETYLSIVKTAKTQMPNWKMTLFSNLRLPWSASEAQKRSLVQICIFFPLENTIICQNDFEICKNSIITAFS